MDATLALAESLSFTPRSKKRRPEPVAQSAAMETFFADPLPQTPPKPQLPPELMSFCYLHRMAATGSMPVEKANQVIEAIHAVADMLPQRDRRRLRIEAYMEELQELSDWLLAWTPPQFEEGEDPFEGE